MATRRSFLKAIPAIGSAGCFKLSVSSVLAQSNQIKFFGVHPFVEDHPEAVFIMETDVDVKTNTKAIKNAGLEFGRSVFVPKETGGIPITNEVAVKPNLTCSFPGKRRFFFGKLKFPLEYGMGIVTDPYFVEGTIESIKELGLSGNQFYIREVNCPDDFGPRGYKDMAKRTGADLRNLEAEIGEISENDIQWVDVPNGWIHKKIPYLWPVNAHDSWLLNISKFKAHGMGLTLCCKNHQGSIAHHYQQYCGGIWALKKVREEHLIPGYKEKCKEGYERHVADKIPRWDKPGLGLNGSFMDIWATRTLDNLSVSPMGLCIIEGIYGRDGNGFLNGPNKGKYDENEAWDYMTNVIIFGKNPFHVDIIGHWLGGHEPGNFGLFHLARERGMLDVLDPRDIPVYLWQNGKAELTPLENFTRTPLKTYYLQRDYNGQNEPKYHLVNEPFDYGKFKSHSKIKQGTPAIQAKNVISSGTGKTTISFDYFVPQDNAARLEIYDIRGKMLSVLFDKQRKKGHHLATWKRNVSPGTYYCRYRCGDNTEKKNNIACLNIMLDLSIFSGRSVK